ncbi:MAG TPA: PBP1A family penicillin-binding protein [Vicinamibacteria bacterium]|nr:PBP1A family penicillin-binding protein [Vicinamibacteria bacterium]
MTSVTVSALRLGVLRRAGVTFLFALAILAGALLGIVLAYESDLPQVSSLEDFEPNIITQVYAADGELLGNFAIEKRVVVSFADIPPILRNAIVAVEDEDFWKHIGINVWRVPSAAFSNLRAGRRSQGFSTLTMQLSRVLFLTPDKTYERKAKEIILAFQIEKNFTKEEIFTLYCNQIYFGHGNYGVEATSRSLFSKSIKDLNLPEAALIAGLAQNPARLSPLDHPQRATQRRNHVIDRMAEEKYITAEEAAAARTEPLRLRPHKDPPSIAAYFLEEVRKYLEREYGSQRIYQGGLRVHTTLDARLQRAANRAVRRGLRRLDRRARGFVPPEASILRDGEFPARLHLDEWDWPLEEGDVVRGVVLESDRALAVVQIGEYHAAVGPRQLPAGVRRPLSEILPRGTVAPFLVQSLGEEGGRRVAHVLLEQEPRLEGALLALDPRTGAVRAMVGGYDFERSKFNRATQAMRQVGSAFKPIVYAAAIEQAGYTPATLVDDSPISLPDNQGLWTPHNYDYTFWGPISLRRAVEQSRNLPAIRTLQAVGIGTGIEYARKLGLSGEQPPYLPLAIGAGEATLSDMTAAFASFANQGLRMKPMYITRITDRDGNVIEEPRPVAKDAIRADTAYLLTSLLRGVVERGTAMRARALKRPVAGKTGTTNDYTDGWFIGFEPALAAGVWVGFDEKKESLGRGQDGGRTALPIWLEFFAEAMKDAPLEDFAVPANIVFVPVDAAGQPAPPGAQGVRMEAFVAGTQPRAMPRAVSLEP